MWLFSVMFYCFCRLSRLMHWRGVYRRYMHIIWSFVQVTQQ